MGVVEAGGRRNWVFRFLGHFYFFLSLGSKNTSDLGLREPGVQAGSRGASEGELGPWLQQRRRQGSGVVGIALQRLVELWRHMPAVAAFLRQAPFISPSPPRPRRARCLPPWAARAPGAAGSTALCPTGGARATRLPDMNAAWVGGSADSAASPAPAASSARRLPGTGAGSGSDRVGWLHSAMPHRGRRHIVPLSARSKNWAARHRLAIPGKPPDLLLRAKPPYTAAPWQVMGKTRARLAAFSHTRK